MTIGAAIILALTFAPYALVSDARRAVTTYIGVPLGKGDAPAAPAAAVAAPTPAPLPAFDVAGWYSSREDDPGRHALLVQSTDGRVTLAEHNADASYNPASLVKLATSLVALRKLGKDFRFETRVFIDGNVDESGMLHGRLLVSGHDPTFGDFHTTLIAKKLAERGIKKFEGEIAVTRDFSFNFTDKPDEAAHRLAKVLKLNPKKWAEVDAPAGEPAFAVLSYPLRDILLYTNAHSSNFVAERLGAMVGGPEGIRAYLVNELKLPPEQVTLATASGLELNRMTARGLVTVIRALDEEARRQGMELVDIMAVASGDYGTLRRRMVGTPLEGAVVAKTGTLVHDDGGMASLGGVIYTQKYGKVYFVVLNQGSDVAVARQGTDELLSAITLSQDTPAPIPKPEKPRHQLESSDLEVLE
jgi:D-alanyl-D-alanine carboxypeptidase/D-alanyl-D-alanine-endopeptidase (penicillin-binding protein 4)